MVSTSSTDGVGSTDGVVVCVDFGSTFTKAALVEVPSGSLLAHAEHPTTIDTDVLDGYDACAAVLAAADPRAADAEVLACSSAGGGLRIAVVGNEALVTAEAGRRVALSSGGKVVHVSSGGLDAAGVEELREAQPDVVLLVGGTDGGNSAVLLGCGRTLAEAGWRTPVVVAGNADARDEVAALLDGAGTPYVLADNVVPRIGVLEPASARRAIRAMFLSHVIGGKHLSQRADFTTMVRGATPDVVLGAVEVLARGTGTLEGAGDVVVVDVGGATTDVYSVVDPGESEEVVALTAATRTVEGDLGMRWSATTTLDAAVEAGFLAGTAEERAAVALRHDDPAYLPDDPDQAQVDVALAAAAIGLAVRRHAGRAQVRYDAAGGRFVERSGTDLREVELLVGSGGVLRHGVDAGRHLADHLTTDGGWQVPEHPRVVVDTDYVLAPAGLLAEQHPEAAHRLLQRLGGIG